MTMRDMLAIAAAGLAAGPAAAQMMAVDSGNDRVMLLDALDGAVIDADWLTDLGAVGWAFTTPKEAIIVAGEIWVADQVEDAVHRFDLDRNYLSSITTGPGGAVLDNIRSLGTDGTTVWVTNDGGTFANSVVSYDTDGTPLASFVVEGTSPFDAEPFMGDLLVSDTGASAVQRHEMGGAFVGTFASGISFPEQVVVLDDDSVLVSNAIDSAGVEGLWHYNADGTVRAFVDTAGIGGPVMRGGNLLDNGDYILGTASGIYTARSDGAGGFDFTLVAGEPIDIQYITRMPEDDCYADCDESGTLDFFDFLCFQNAFGAMEPYADCDGSGTHDFFDFLCFQNAFGEGCP